MLERETLDELFKTLYGCLMQVAYSACMEGRTANLSLAETTWSDDGGAGDPDWLEIDGPNSTRRMFGVQS